MVTVEVSGRWIGRVGTINDLLRGAFFSLTFFLKFNKCCHGNDQKNKSRKVRLIPLEISQGKNKGLTFAPSLLLLSYYCEARFPWVPVKLMEKSLIIQTELLNRLSEVNSPAHQESLLETLKKAGDAFESSTF